MAGCAGRCSPPAPVTSAAQVALEGVTYSEFAGARLARRIRAEQLLVVPRRFGVLELSPLSELVLTRPSFEVFEASGGAGDERDARSLGPDDAASAAPPVGALLASRRPPLPGLGAARHLVSALLLEPTFTFVRDGAPVARLEARRARADARSRDLVLRTVRLEHLATGRTLTAERAVWLADEEALWIEGDYVLRERGASTRGRGLRVDVQPRSSSPSRRDTPAAR